MKYLKYYESVEFNLGNKGVLMAKENLIIFDVNNEEQEISKGSFVLYKRISKVNKEYEIEIIGDSYTYFIYELDLLNSIDKFEKIDTSKPFKLEFSGGVKYYNSNIELHREGGPAVINNEYEAWFKNGKLHREDGPAETSEGDQYWFINGVQFDEKDFKVISKKMMGQRDDISKEELIDLLSDIIDEYDSYYLTYLEDILRWNVDLKGTTNKKIYGYLESLASRLEEKGQSIVGIGQNSEKLVLNIQ